MKDKEKNLNVIVITVAVIALAIIAVASVLAIKAGRESNPVPEVTGETVQAYNEESSVFEQLVSTTVEVLTDNMSTTVQNTTEKKTEKATKAQKEETKAVSEMQEEATVPVLDENEMSKGKTSSVATASTNLPKDMSLAGLSRSGYNVVGLKEYIYNNDMDPNCAQRNLGYNKFYDWGAQLIDFSISTARMKFNYDGKDYMIQVWKGQYISGEFGTVGGEVGIYTRPEGKSAANSHYNCAGTDDELYMELTIFWDENDDGNYLPQFTRNYSRHWWQTGYVDGQLKNIKDSTPLRLLSHITMKDEEQAIAFEKALNNAGFDSVGTFSPNVPDTCKRSGKDVIFIWQYI